MDKTQILQIELKKEANILFLQKKLESELDLLRSVFNLYLPG